MEGISRVTDRGWEVNDRLRPDLPNNRHGLDLNEDFLACFQLQSIGRLASDVGQQGLLLFRPPQPKTHRDLGSVLCLNFPDVG